MLNEKEKLTSNQYIVKLQREEDKAINRESRQFERELNALDLIGLAILTGFLLTEADRFILKQPKEEIIATLTKRYNRSLLTKRLQIKRILGRITNPIETVIEDIPVPRGRPKLERPRIKQRNDIIAKRLEILQRTLPKTSATRITNQLVSALSKGTTHAEILAIVKKNLSQQRQSRARVIATTEATALSGEMTLSALKNAGYKRKIWVTRDDRKVRNPAHVRLHNTDKRLDKTFAVIYSNGTRLDLLAPEEPNCRCRLFPK